AHGDGTLGDFFAGGEGFAIVVDRLPAENLQPRPRGKARRRFIESNMAITPNTKNLQVDAAGHPNLLFVRRTILFVVALNHSIGNVSSCRGDVDVAEKILAHKKVKALRMIRCDAEVLIEIKGSDMREVERLLAIETNDFDVHSEGGAAGGEPQSE